MLVSLPFAPAARVGVACRTRPHRSPVHMSPRVGGTAGKVADVRSSASASAGSSGESEPPASDAVDQRPAASDPPETTAGPPPPEDKPHGPPLRQVLLEALTRASKAVAKVAVTTTAGVLTLTLLNLVVPRANKQSPPPTKVHYSTFLGQLKRKDVAVAEIDDAVIVFGTKSGAKAVAAERLRLAELAKATAAAGLPAETPDPAAAQQAVFLTIKPKAAPLPVAEMEAAGVVFGAPDHRGSNRWGGVFTTILYLGIAASLIGRLPFPPGLRFPQISAGRKAAKKGDKGAGARPPVTFADVAGVDEAKEELAEIVDYLKSPDRYSKLGAKPPCGILLVGAPGTGKGMGASRVRDLYAKARAEAPSIVFVDEIDAIGKGRDPSGGRGLGGGNDEREQTLNQLLTELDGFESSSMVITLAATNRPDVLDAALRRPGRFDRTVTVERPDKQGRREILAVHVRTKKLPLDSRVDLDAVAAMTSGFSGAELAMLVNEAALLAARANKATVSAAEFESAVLRCVAGVEKKRSVLSPAEKVIVATHEAGHAIVATAAVAAARNAGAKAPSPVEKLSIVARSGGALGFTYSPQQDDQVLFFEDDLRGKLAVLLAGRAAEEVAVGHVSTGAADDLQRATGLAYKAIAEWGLCTALGPVSMAALAAGGDGGAPLLRDGGGHMQTLVEKEVKMLLEEGLGAARELLLANSALLHAMGAVLAEREKLEGAPLRDLLARVAVTPAFSAFMGRSVARPGP